MLPPWSSFYETNATSQRTGLVRRGGRCRHVLENVACRSSVMPLNFDAELPEQKTPDIGGFLDLFAPRFALAVAGGGFYAQQYRRR